MSFNPTNISFSFELKPFKAIQFNTKMLFIPWGIVTWVPYSRVLVLSYAHTLLPTMWMCGSVQHLYSVGPMLGWCWPVLADVIPASSLCWVIVGLTGGGVDSVISQPLTLTGSPVASREPALYSVGLMLGWCWPVLADISHRRVAAERLLARQAGGDNSVVSWSLTLTRSPVASTEPGYISASPWLGG